MTHNNKAPFGRLGAREEGGTVYRVKARVKVETMAGLPVTVISYIAPTCNKMLQLTRESRDVTLHIAASKGDL